MPWDEQNTLARFAESPLDRLSTAGALLSATGWIDQLARLVAIDTAFPPGDSYLAFTSTLQDLFAPLGFGLRRVELPESLWRDGQAAGPRVNLVASRRTGLPVCSIPCHMDTAPAGAGGTRPPLALTRQGSRLFGRGTVDMKGAIIALWAALRAADAVGLPLRFDPLLLFTTDGAGGRFPGLRHLAEQGELEGHVLCLNGTAAPRIWAGCLGTFDLEIRVSGCPAHPGGRSVAQAMRPVVALIEGLQAELARRRSRLPAPPDQGGGLLRPGISIVTIGAETEPEGKEPVGVMVVTRRFTAEEGFCAALEELKARVAQALEGTDCCTAECCVLRRLEPVVDPDEGAHWQRWQQAMGWGFGFPQDSFRRWGGQEGTALGFVQRAGIREILLGGLHRPGQPPLAADEHTTVEDVEALARSVLAYLADVPAVPELP